MPSRAAGFAPRALFYTFENQPWEKAMLAGFRNALPGTMFIGVQHAPLADAIWARIQAGGNGEMAPPLTCW